MKLLAVIAGMAGSLAGILATRGVIAVAASGFELPPNSQEDLLGLLALSFCALGVLGSMGSLGGRLAAFLLVAAGGGFWYFLPDYAIPAAPLLLLGAVFGFLEK